MRIVTVLGWPAVVLAACGGESGSGGSVDAGDGGGGGGSADACVGLHCQIADCRAQGKVDTSISGRVFAPNGTLPLYGISVYVPATDPGAFPDGAQCSRCSDELPGKPIVEALSGEDGRFTLYNVPA